MNRIDAIFEDLRRRDAKGLMPYITCGDPDVDTTGMLLGALQESGASIVELGVPFSDPIADGPTIQASMTEALARGFRLDRWLEMVASQRASLSIGLVAMVSYSIVHRYRDDRFVKEAVAAGIDGFIIPDLPLQEAARTRERIGEAGAILSMLISPTTPIERAEQIAKASSGFVYLLSRAGVTGERSELPSDLPGRIERLRSVTDLPITVGFGISDAQQVASVVSVADAAIVGSAIVKVLSRYREHDAATIVEHVGRFVRELASGLKTPAEAG